MAFVDCMVYLFVSIIGVKEHLFGVASGDAEGVSVVDRCRPLPAIEGAVQLSEGLCPRGEGLAQSAPAGPEGAAHGVGAGVVGGFVEVAAGVGHGERGRGERAQARQAEGDAHGAASTHTFISRDVNWEVEPGEVLIIQFCRLGAGRHVFLCLVYMGRFIHGPRTPACR